MSYGGPWVVGLRDPLAEFAADMEIRLRDNDHKGGWDRFPVLEAMKRLREELEELDVAVRTALAAACGCRTFPCDCIAGNQLERDQVVFEAADVANFAMMVADMARHQLDGWCA